MKNVICGKIVSDGEIKNILTDIDDAPVQKIKELFFINEFNEVDSFIGFEDLEIIEVDPEGEMASDAISAIQDSNGEISGVVFTDKGFLYITDIMFFDAFYYVNGENVTYDSIVTFNTYDEDMSARFAEEEYLL